MARTPRPLRGTLREAGHGPDARVERRRTHRVRARARHGGGGDLGADTWITGERIAELESISVLPEHRGAGIGSALFGALDRELEARGIEDVVIGALPGNEGAIRMYERRGYRPTWLYLSRFAGGTTERPAEEHGGDGVR
jgi:ribosomal protein S18 acetylase RimI-like enzyme